MRRTCALLLLLTLAPMARSLGQDVVPADRQLINRIIVRTHNIFDSTETSGNVLFGLANAIHFTTRPSVVRHELLFAEGEPYDEATVAETARNLRARGLFRDVQVEVQDNGDGTVDIYVDTYDGWSTQLILNASFTAGELTWALGARETNVFGTGASAGLVYRNEPDRNALQLNAFADRIRGSRFMVGGFWDNLSDGDFGVWNVGQPFRAFSERTGFMFSGQGGRQRILQFAPDRDSANIYLRRLFRQRGEFAFAPVAGSGGYVRIGLAAEIRREEFIFDTTTVIDSLNYTLEPGAVTVPDSVTGTVGILVEATKPRYRVVRYYSGFGRDEDIDLSTRAGFFGWLAPKGFGYDATGVGPGVVAQTGFGAGRAFMLVRGQANGLFTSAGLDSGQVAVQMTAAAQILPKSSTVLHVEWAQRKGPPPGFEYDFGHGRGPRSFGPHAFVGDRAVWLALEQRAFVFDNILGLMGIGFTAFLDYGGAWYADRPRRLGGDVGLGLRFGSLRSIGNNLGRFDVGYRFGEGWCNPDEAGACRNGRLALSFGSGFAF
jgi:hypothetical protein